MLKGIPSNISSNLLKALADMGHGDIIAVVDHFYPAYSKGNGGLVVEAKGCSVPEILKSILSLIPLDSDYSDMPVKIMKPDPGYENFVSAQPQVWNEIVTAVSRSNPDIKVGYISRSDFYQEASHAFVTVSTSEERPYGCVLLQKGVK